MAMTSGSLCLAFGFILQLVTRVKLATVYMDCSGDCSRDSYISVKDEEYTIRSHGGEPYDTLVCEMVFKSEKNDRLCVSFKEFRIKRCDLNLDVYAEQSASGTAIGHYDCHTEDVPESLCSSGKYLTVQLRKQELSHHGYYFHLEVREFTSSDAFAEGIDVFIVSIGVIIGIIVGVIVVVILTAVVIVYCCCKNKQYGLVNKQSRKSTSYRTAASDVPVEPSAPPAEDQPPAYTEPPPPYSTTDPPHNMSPSFTEQNSQSSAFCHSQEKAAFV